MASFIRRTLQPKAAQRVSSSRNACIVLPILPREKLRYVFSLRPGFALGLEPTITSPGLYLVREGDTLESIAFAFNTSVDAITITNNISDANVIYIGQPLIIPSLITDTDNLSLPLQLDQPKDVTPTP